MSTTVYLQRSDAIVMRVQALDRRVEVQVRDTRKGVIVHPEHLQHASRSSTVNDITASPAARK